MPRIFEDIQNPIITFVASKLDFKRNFANLCEIINPGSGG